MEVHSYISGADGAGPVLSLGLLRESDESTRRFILMLATLLAHSDWSAEELIPRNQTEVRQLGYSLQSILSLSMLKGDRRARIVQSLDSLKSGLLPVTEAVHLFSPSSSVDGAKPPFGDMWGVVDGFHPNDIPFLSQCLGRHYGDIFGELAKQIVVALEHGN